MFMNFKDYFDINEFFNPSVYNDDKIKLGGFGNYEYLFTNSINLPKKKTNMYFEFLEKHFWTPLKMAINIKNIDKEVDAVVLSSTHNIFDTKDKERRITFSFLSFILSIRKYMGLDKQCYEELDELLNNNGIYTYEELYEILKNAIIRRRSIFFDIRNKGTNSEYYIEIRNKLRRLNIEVEEDFWQAIQIQIDECNALLIGMKRIRNIFSEELPKEELLECFDYDKFCLITAKSALDSSDSRNSATIYIEKYLEAVKKYRDQNPNYNCTIFLVDSKLSKKIKYTIDDLEREYEDFLTKNPSAIPFNIELTELHNLLRNNGLSEDEIQNFDLSKPENMELLYELLERQKQIEVLQASWHIIPKGTKTTMDIEIEKSSSSKGLTLSEEEKNRRMLVSYRTLEESNYLFKLEGINEFVGYIGYMYPNGKVIFEKFYDNFDTKKVASKSATYIINDFNYFIEVSKMTKTEIIDKLRSGQLKGIVQRVYHQEDMTRWTSKVTQALIGTDYTSDVLKYIDNVIQCGILRPKGESK